MPTSFDVGRILEKLSSVGVASERILGGGARMTLLKEAERYG